MQTEKLRSYLLMGALLFQSFLFNAVPQTVLGEEGVETLEEPVESRLVISAVQITGGPGHTQEDFIELYNPTSEPFDLNGYRLVKRTAAATVDATVQSWSESTAVLPYHFYLWANNSYSAITAQSDTTSSATLADNNGIALRHGSNDTGEIVESIAWGSTSNSFRSVSDINPSANESLLREQLFEDNSNFAIQVSSPRNSSVEFLPDVEDTEEEEDEGEDETEEDDEESDEQEDEEDAVEPNIIITELLPNPSGSDSGFEQVEIHNAGSEPVNLEGYKIDDIASTDSFTSNAYTLSEMEIPPNSYTAIIVPVGKFAMNNTTGDVVSLFNPHGVSIDSVQYTGTAPEGKTYSYFTSSEDWHWTTPTLGEENGQPPIDDENEGHEESDDKEDDEDLGDYDNSGLEISEIYPDPDGNASEFVEIHNVGEESAQLSKVSLSVGDKAKVLPSFELAPSEYYVIEQGSLLAQLRNAGQTVKLIEDGTVLSTVTYPLAIDGASFARFEDGFLWTIQVTKAESNVLEIPKSIKEVAAKVVTTKPTTTKVPAVKKVAQATAKTPAKSAAVTPAVKQSTNTTNKAGAGLSMDTAVAPGEQEQGSDTKKNDPLGKIIAMGAAAVAAGVFALYKFVFAAGIE